VEERIKLFGEVERKNYMHLTDTLAVREGGTKG
jgi:hypothetical protein